MIIPTVGRESLKAALASCEAADEVIVVENQDGDHGYSARMKGMAQATGTHLAFLDDDDVYAFNGVELMRDLACDRPVIFRMDHPAHGVLWRDRSLEFGNVGTPMFLVPNDPERLGRWEPHIPGITEPGGDYTFIRGCVERMGEPVWREEVVAMIRPEGRGPTVTVVTPWRNHSELAADYWDAMDAAGCPVIVVDNGSDPPIPDAHRLEENAGFSRASNIGLELADTEAVLFLNNDVAMTRRGWLTELREQIEPGVLVGAKLRYDRHADVDGQPFPYLDGWCLAGMRDDLDNLGGFDESFDEPAYYSDNDLCLRARAAGMVLREAPVGLVHKLNVTAGHGPDVWDATRANYRRYAQRARELMEVAA